MNQNHEIECHELHQRLKTGDEIVVIDCREQWEYELNSLPDSHHFPLSEFSSRFQELERFRESEIVVICHHGVRSLQLTQWMIENGYPQVKSVQGGIDRWSQDIDSAVPRY